MELKIIHKGKLVEHLNLTYEPDVYINGKKIFYKSGKNGRRV